MCMSIENGKISVIIPTYNCAKTILKSIDSVYSQTYRNYEIIIVDDGSTDNTLEIIRKRNYDDRLKIIVQKNTGVSSARNNGLKNCAGKYVMFLDSDDYMKPEMMQIMLEELSIKKVDLVISGFTYVREEGELDNIPPKYSGDITAVDEKLFIKLYTNSFFNAPWNKLYNKSIIDSNNIRFDCELSILEDLDFSLHYMSCINTLSVVNKSLYYYERRGSGGLLRRFNKNKYKGIYKTFTKMKYLEDTLKYSDGLKKQIGYSFFRELVLFQRDVLCSSLKGYEKKMIINEVKRNKVYEEIFMDINKQGINIIVRLFYLFPDLMLRLYALVRR